MVRMTDPTPTATKPHRVLIAEDEALIRLDLAEMLREEGYEVVGEAGDGQEAVELAEQLTPGPGDHGRQDAPPRRHRRGLGDRGASASRRS